MKHIESARTLLISALIGSVAGGIISLILYSREGATSSTFYLIPSAAILGIAVALIARLFPSTQVDEHDFIHAGAVDPPVPAPVVSRKPTTMKQASRSSGAVLVVIIAFYAIRCTNSPAFNKPLELDLSTVSGDESAKELVRENWKKVQAACPGFTKYKQDLQLVELNDVRSYETTDEPGRVDVVLRVADKPSTIPNSFKAWGQNCFYGISVNGLILSISKRPCIAVCKETWIDTTYYTEFLR